jgi:hypothetical protein
MLLDSIRVRNLKRTSLYCKEMQEVRKGIRTINYAKFALEKISKNLQNIENFTDMKCSIESSIHIMRFINKKLKHILPNVEGDLASISNMMIRTLTEEGEFEKIEIDEKEVDINTERILNDTEIQVDREMKEKLPPIPHL